MANTIKVLYWLRRTKTNKEGQIPLMVRLSYQTCRVDKASGYYIHPLQWNKSKQRLRGTQGHCKEINSWLDITVTKTADLYREATLNNNLNISVIMDNLFGIEKEEPVLLKMMADHNENLRLRVGKDYAYSTYEKYVFTYNKVKAFINQVLKSRDIFLKDITAKFIMDFDHYLRVHDNNQHNTAVKYCINLKRILNLAVIQGIITVNPLNNHRTVYKDTKQVYLSEQEIKALEAVSLTKPSLMLVRDLFLFQCHTGLAYTDMVSLQKTDISIDSTQQQWIIKPRQKTGVISTIPLSNKALLLINKYHISSHKTAAIFPHYSIQKYNQYITEIGEQAGINQKLSSHVGRRTFGNVALSKGVSINVISKILGHSNTIITQRIYAITTQNIISLQLDKLQ